MKDPLPLLGITKFFFNLMENGLSLMIAKSKLFQNKKSTLTATKDKSAACFTNDQP